MKTLPALAVLVCLLFPVLAFGQWQPDGNFVGDGSSDNDLVVIPDGAGGAILTWSFDDRAHALPSGVHFYKISANGFSDTKKMVLLK